MQTVFWAAFIISIVAIIYSWRKTKAVKNENPDDFETNDDYQKFSKIKKKAIIVCIASFLLSTFLGGSNEITPNDFAENVQTDGKTLGITPEEFMKKYNSTLNRLSKDNVEHLNIVRIDKLGEGDGQTIFFIQKDDDANVKFNGMTDGKNLVSVYYSKSNTFDSYMMPVFESIMFSIPYTNRNMVKNFKSFFENKDYLSKTFYKGMYAGDSIVENGIKIDFGMVDDHRYTRGYNIGIFNENAIARMKREGKIY